MNWWGRRVFNLFDLLVNQLVARFKIVPRILEKKLIMNKEKAISIAKNYLIQKNQENPSKDKFQFIISEPKEFEKFWYFDFKIELLTPKKDFAVGGAPGFTVNKENNQIEVVSWEQYNSILK